MITRQKKIGCQKRSGNSGIPSTFSFLLSVNISNKISWVYISMMEFEPTDNW